MTRLSAEIVAIGTELVMGEAVDTNSAWLAARLGELGVRVTRHVSVDDRIDDIVDVLADAASRSDAVIVTGGLGPTPDDLTRHAVARLIGVPLERRDDLVAYITGYFTRTGRAMPESNLLQADVPRGARILEPQGTAPGFAVDVESPAGSSTIYCLPGVPREMEGMAAASVFGELTARAGLGTTVSRTVRTAGMSESHVAEMLDDVVADSERTGQPGIAFLASKGETRVRVTATAADRGHALAIIDPVVGRIVSRLGAGVAGLDDEGPEHAVFRQLRQLGKTLGIAESMTAGAVAARIARIPGASEVLKGGLVVYATATKTHIAGVDPSILDAHGPVSAPVAKALAQGARSRLHADIGLGLVGVAGPAEQAGMPVGRVYLAVATASEVMEREVNVPRRNRADVQDVAVSVAIDFLRRRLANLAASELF